MAGRDASRRRRCRPSGWSSSSCGPDLQKSRSTRSPDPRSGQSPPVSRATSSGVTRRPALVLHIGSRRFGRHGANSSPFCYTILPLLVLGLLIYLFWNYGRDSLLWIGLILIGLGFWAEEKGSLWLMGGVLAVIWLFVRKKKPKLDEWGRPMGGYDSPKSFSRRKRLKEAKKDAEYGYKLNKYKQNLGNSSQWWNPFN